MQYHYNAKTNIQQRRIIKITAHQFSCRDLADRFQVSHETIAKWRRVEYLEDKSSRPDKIYHALSETEQKIIKKVRKRGLFSLDDLIISLSPYIERLNRINCWRTLKRYRLNRFTNKEKKEKRGLPTICQDSCILMFFTCPRLRKRDSIFLVIDRVTKLAFLKVYPRRRQQKSLLTFW